MTEKNINKCTQDIIILESVDRTMLMYASDCSKTLENDSKLVKFVPDYFKTQEMCEKAVKSHCLQ